MPPECLKPLLPQGIWYNHWLYLDKHKQHPPLYLKCSCSITGGKQKEFAWGTWVFGISVRLFCGLLSSESHFSFSLSLLKKALIRHCKKNATFLFKRHVPLVTSTCGWVGNTQHIHWWNLTFVVHTHWFEEICPDWMFCLVTQTLNIGRGIISR